MHLGKISLEAVLGIDEKMGRPTAVVLPPGEVLSPVPKQEQRGRKDRVAVRGIEEQVLPTLDLVALGNGASWLRQWTHFAGRR